MRQRTQLCLFDSDRPCWKELETSVRETLLQLMGQLLLDAALRAVAMKKEEAADDERQDHA